MWKRVLWRFSDRCSSTQSRRDAEKSSGSRDRKSRSRIVLDSAATTVLEAINSTESGSPASTSRRRRTRTSSVPNTRAAGLTGSCDSGRCLFLCEPHPRLTKSMSQTTLRLRVSALRIEKDPRPRLHSNYTQSENALVFAEQRPATRSGFKTSTKRVATGPAIGVLKPLVGESTVVLRQRAFLHSMKRRLTSGLGIRH